MTIHHLTDQPTGKSARCRILPRNDQVLEGGTIHPWERSLLSPRARQVQVQRMTTTIKDTPEPNKGNRLIQRDVIGHHSMHILIRGHNVLEKLKILRTRQDNDRMCSSLCRIRIFLPDHIPFVHGVHIVNAIDHKLVTKLEAKLHRMRLVSPCPITLHRGRLNLRQHKHRRCPIHLVTSTWSPRPHGGRGTANAVGHRMSLILIHQP